MLTSVAFLLYAQGTNSDLKQSTMPVYIDSNPVISSSEEFDCCPDEVMRSVAIGNHEAAADASAVSSFEPSRVDFEPAAAIREHKGTNLQQAPLLVRT